MPIPSPRPDETQDEFVSRCVPVLAGEGKPTDQAAAICFSHFESMREAAHSYGKKKRKREALPEVLDCAPVTVEPGDVDAASVAVALHSYAHALWPSVIGTPAAEIVVQMHNEGVILGTEAGIPHSSCDDLDTVAYEELGVDDPEGSALVEAFKLLRLAQGSGLGRVAGGDQA